MNIRSLMVDMVTSKWDRSSEYALMMALLEANLWTNMFTPYSVIESLWNLRKECEASEKDESGVIQDQVEFKLEQFITSVESEILSCK